MSSCMIIQEHDRFTFAVDTAHCVGDTNLIKYRVRDVKVQKVLKAGRDMVFIAGMTECTEQLKNNLHRFINKKNHVNLEILKQYLKREFPKEKSQYKDTGLNDIGVSVFSVVNNESILYSFSQMNNFETTTSRAKPYESKLFVDGFDNERIYKYALNYIKGLRNVYQYREPDTFIHVYQNLYSEGVGGYIQVYSMDCEGCNMIKEQKLDEKNLRYAIPVQDSPSESNTFKLIPLYQSHIYSSQITGGIISGTDIYGVNITGGTINGTTINGVTVNGSVINSSDAYGSLNIEGAYIRGRNASGVIKLDIDAGGNVQCGNVQCTTVNGREPITRGNIGEQSVAYATEAGSSFVSDISIKLYKNNLTQNAYISANDNFIPSSNQMYIGSSANPWAGGYGVSGWTTTSDERLKDEIKDIDDRYLQLAKMLIPRLFKMKQGTSGRFHVGFIAQEIEEAMAQCGISDMEFAGLVKAPVYAEKLKDENGNELNEYDTSSEIVDYTYHLRYEEFIPLLLARIMDQEERLSTIERMLGVNQ